MISRASLMLWTVAIAGCILLYGGCVRTTQPVLKDDQVIADDTLLGTWISSDNKVHGEITRPEIASAEIKPPVGHEQYKLAYTDETGKTTDLLLRLGKVGDMLIVESTLDKPLADASDVYRSHLLPLYSFALVKQTHPRLVLKLMDTSWLSKYLLAHPTELAVIDGDHDVVVNASTADFQAFLLKHGSDDGAFGEDGIFVRPGDPTTQSTTAPATSSP